MNLRKLPPSMLLTLGLACGDGKSSDESTTVQSCLSPPYEETEAEVGPCLSEDSSFTTSTSTSTSGSSSSGADSTFGPCLSAPETTGTDSGSGSGSDSGSDSGSGTDTGTGTGTTGAMGDEPPSRAAAIERVLERGTLPADVAARLRARRDGH